MPWIHGERVPAARAPFHSFSQSELLWVGQAGTSVESKYLSLWRPSFLDHLPSHVLGSSLALRVPNMLHTFITSLGKNLALNLFVYNTVDSSSFTTVTSVGHPLLNSDHSLNAYSADISSPLSLCISHFGELLEDGSYRWKAVPDSWSF